MKIIFRSMFSSKIPAYWMVRLLPILLFLTTSCSTTHRIDISPSLNDLNSAGITKINKNVGYYISPEDLKKQVVTPGASTDKVKYLPYKETEPALKTVLSNIFTNVYLVPSIGDAQFIASNNISYIFVPKITTDSSSPSNWLYQPTDFTVTIDWKAIDSSGSVVWQKEIKGQAHFNVNDVFKEPLLAGKTATKYAFIEFQQEILKTNIFN